MAAILVVMAVVAGWYGLRVYRFLRDRSVAQEALARYDFPEARQRLASCLSLWPRDPLALLLATQAARREGLLEEAQDHLDRYRERVEKSTPEGALQGVLLLVQRGQVKEYVHTLIDYIEVRHPESEQILEALAQGCAHVYRLDEATFWTKQLLDRFPDNPTGRLLDAQTNETMRRRDRAIEIVRRLVEDYPQNDKARLYLAGLLVKTRKHDEAAEHFRELHRRQPSKIMPLLGLVRVLVTMEKEDEAKPFFEKLEQEHGDNSEALLEYARFALRQKRPGDAEPILRRALQLSPSDHEIHFELAVCLRQLDRPDESRKHVERHKEIQGDLMRLEKVFQAMVKAPSDPGPRLEAGQICMRNGQIAEGLRWLTGVLDLVPDHKPTHKILADHFESVGDRTRAEYHRTRGK
jgi:predicted Zn-dependent protease